MKSNKKRYFIVALIALMIVNLFIPTFVFAETNVETNTGNEVKENKNDLFGEGEVMVGGLDTGLKNGNMADLEAKIERKGSELVSLSQTIGQPVTILAFIFIGVFSLLLGGKNGAAAGVKAMIISLFMYAAIIFAPNIFEFFTAWIAN